MVMKLKTIRQRCYEEPEAQEQAESCKGKQEMDPKGSRIEAPGRKQDSVNTPNKLIRFAL